MRKSDPPTSMNSAAAKPAVSVVIPTHNPRHDYLARVVDALRQQTLPREQWELLVVDNGSEQPLRAAGPKYQGSKGLKGEESSADIDLGWHANARIVREEELGLTYARLRGFA